MKFAFDVKVNLTSNHEVDSFTIKIPAYCYLLLSMKKYQLLRAYFDSAFKTWLFTLLSIEPTTFPHIDYNNALYSDSEKDNHHPGDGNTDDMFRDTLAIYQKASMAYNTLLRSEFVQNIMFTNDEWKLFLDHVIEDSGIQKEQLENSKIFIGLMDSLITQLIDYFKKKENKEKIEYYTSYEAKFNELVSSELPFNSIIESEMLSPMLSVVQIKVSILPTSLQELQNKSSIYTKNINEDMIEGSIIHSIHRALIEKSVT